MVSDAPALAQPCGVHFSSCPDALRLTSTARQVEGPGTWDAGGLASREDTGMGAQVGRGREGGTVP